MATSKTKASAERTLITLDPSISRQVEELIVSNRAQLIKATVKDQSTQRDLIAVSEAIQRISVRSPDQVAAWGLGCGGNCLVGPDIFRGDPLAIRSK